MQIKGMSNHSWDKPYKAEADFLKDAKRWLEFQRRRGVKMIRINERIQQGYSDLFVCVRGIFVVLELKDDTGVPTAQQVQFIDDMKAAGAIGGVVRTMNEIVAYTEEAMRISPKAGWRDEP